MAFNRLPPASGLRRSASWSEEFEPTAPSKRDPELTALIHERSSKLGPRPRSNRRIDAYDLAIDRQVARQATPVIASAVFPPSAQQSRQPDAPPSPQFLPVEQFDWNDRWALETTVLLDAHGDIVGMVRKDESCLRSIKCLLSPAILFDGPLVRIGVAKSFARRDIESQRHFEKNGRLGYDAYHGFQDDDALDEWRAALRADSFMAPLVGWRSETFDHLIMPLARCSLQDVVDSAAWRITFDADRVRTLRTVLDQVGYNLAMLHLRGWAHQELKPSEILLDAGIATTIEAQLIDFGWSRPNQLQKLVSGSPSYKSPDWLRESFWPMQDDAWAFGRLALLGLNAPVRDRPCVVPFPWDYHRKPPSEGDSISDLSPSESLASSFMEEPSTPTQAFMLQTPVTAKAEGNAFVQAYSRAHQSRLDLLSMPTVNDGQYSPPARMPANGRHLPRWPRDVLAHFSALGTLASFGNDQERVLLRLMDPQPDTRMSVLTAWRQWLPQPNLPPDTTPNPDDEVKGLRRFFAKRNQQRRHERNERSLILDTQLDDVTYGIEGRFYRAATDPRRAPQKGWHSEALELLRGPGGENKDARLFDNTADARRAKCRSVLEQLSKADVNHHRLPSLKVLPRSLPRLQLPL